MGILNEIFQHVFLPLPDKGSMVLHPVSARKPEIIDYTTRGSFSAAKWEGAHFITLAVPESIQTYKYCMP